MYRIILVSGCGRRLPIRRGWHPRQIRRARGNGEFTFEIGKAAVTIVDKPFWLPEILLKQKITEGLDTFCTDLV
jgi:hypothetical protein